MLGRRVLRKPDPVGPKTDVSGAKRGEEDSALGRIGAEG
jgi:hypothetical protein